MGSKKLLLKKRKNKNSSNCDWLGKKSELVTVKKANGGRLNVTKNGGKMALAATPTTTPTVSTAATLQEVINFSCHTLDKATKAKLTLENYYSNLISLNRERRERWQRLEDTLKAESMPEDQKVEKR